VVSELAVNKWTWNEKNDAGESKTESHRSKKIFLFDNISRRGRDFQEFLQATDPQWVVQ